MCWNHRPPTFEASSVCFGVDGALIALYGVFLGAGYGWLSVVRWLHNWRLLGCPRKLGSMVGKWVISPTYQPLTSWDIQVFFTFQVSVQKKVTQDLPEVWLDFDCTYVVLNGCVPSFSSRGLARRLRLIKIKHFYWNWGSFIFQTCPYVNPLYI